MKKQYFHNVWKLMKFILKRDWLRITLWVASIVFIEMVLAKAVTDMFPTSADRESFKAVMLNPVMIAMFGSGYGLDNYTFGAMWAHMMYLWMGLIVAVMAIILVSRHLRDEEEEGRYELIRSLPVGRDAYLLATTLVMAGVFLIMAVLKTITLAVLNIPDMDFLGSLNYAFGLSLIGMFFIAICSVLSQLYQSNRTVMGMSFSVLMVFYLLKAIGEVSIPVLKWLSPFHWMTASQAYVGNLAWPLLLLLAATVGLIFLAIYLSTIRDLDAGFFKVKEGKKEISSYVRRPFGFAVRTQVSMITFWGVTLFILGASYGSIFGDLESFLASNDMFQQLLPVLPGVPVATQFMGMIMIVMGMSSAIPAVMVANKLASEEKKKRLDVLYSHAVSRHELLLGYSVLALIVGIVMMFMSVAGLYLASSAVMDDPIPFMTMIEAIAVYLPSMILMIGFMILMTGFKDDLGWIGYLYLGISWFIVYIGQMVDFGDILVKLTPFSYVPTIPIDDMNWLTQSIITLIGLAMFSVGYVRYGKRDLS